MHEFSAYYKDHKDRVSASSTSGNQNATDQQEKKDPFLRSNKANRNHFRKMEKKNNLTFTDFLISLLLSRKRQANKLVTNLLVS